MIDNVFRARLPRYAGPLLAVYSRLSLTPNQVTLLGFGLAILASVAVARGFWWVALPLWWVSRVADGTDGLHARQTGQATSFGAYLDILLDMAAYGAMVLGFAWAVPQLGAQWLAMLFLYILCITSALALGSQEERLARPATIAACASGQVSRRAERRESPTASSSCFRSSSRGRRCSGSPCSR